MNTLVRPTFEALIRPNFKRMAFYQSARTEFDGKAEVLLDANENPFGDGNNRYPDPLQLELRAAIAKTYELDEESIFIGNGSSEAIDLLMRLICRPGIDRVWHLPPTFGLYEVDAALNDISLVDVALDGHMQPDMGLFEQRLSALHSAGGVEDLKDRILFICSPNNPTGNDLDHASIMQMIERFPGIVVLDQAYVEFSAQPPYRQLIRDYDHLVVLETMSKAYGLAGSRVGTAFAHPNIVRWLNNIKPPYNVALGSAAEALEAVLEREGRIAQEIEFLIGERERVLTHFDKAGFFRRVYPSQANFILVAHPEAGKLYQFLLSQGIVVRTQTGKMGSGHLRITIGSREENDRLLAALQTFAVQA